MKNVRWVRSRWWSVPRSGGRNGYFTLLLMANVPLTCISEQLGHKDPSVTVEHYARWLPGSNREAMDVLPEPGLVVAKETATRQLEDTNRPQ